MFGEDGGVVGYACAVVIVSRMFEGRQSGGVP